MNRGYSLEMLHRFLSDPFTLRLERIAPRLTVVTFRLGAREVQILACVTPRNTPLIHIGLEAVYKDQGWSHQFYLQCNAEPGP
jgi:hypothetical protein